MLIVFYVLSHYVSRFCFPQNLVVFLKIIYSNLSLRVAFALLKALLNFLVFRHKIKTKATRCSTGKEFQANATFGNVQILTFLDHAK